MFAQARPAQQAITVQPGRHQQPLLLVPIAQPENTLKHQEPPIALVATTARLGRFGTGVGDLPLESASPAECAPPAKPARGVYRVPLEIVRRVSQANTRQPRGQLRATHARLLQRVRPGRTASTVVETLKGPAQIAEAVLLVHIASSASPSRRDVAPPAHWARTRPAWDLSPVQRVVQAAKQASIRADAAQVQGFRSVRTALLPREVTATRDPRLAARRQEPRVRLVTPALVEFRTSNFATSRQEDTARLDPCQQEAQCARQGSGAQEVQTTRQPVQEARMLLRRAQHLMQRAPTALQGPSRPRELQDVLSAPLEQSLLRWARPPATSVNGASMPCPRVLFSAQVAPRERPANPAASRKWIAIWTATTLGRSF